MPQNHNHFWVILLAEKVITMRKLFGDAPMLFKYPAQAQRYIENHLGNSPYAKIVQWREYKQ